VASGNAPSRLSSDRSARIWPRTALLRSAKGMDPSPGKSRLRVSKRPLRHIAQKQGQNGPPCPPSPFAASAARRHRAEATRVQLGAGRRCASAATAAICGWDAHDTVGPPASAVVSLSMLTKTVPTPRRARRARARNLRNEEGPQIMGGDTGGRRLRMPSIAVPGPELGCWLSKVNMC